MAGKPGAIYAGDITQLAGWAPVPGLGGFKGNVPLQSLENHRYIYESAYYRELLEKARLPDPTPLEYEGPAIEIRHVCINRTLIPCVLLETYFAPNLLERTNGKLKFTFSSLLEMGLGESEALTLLTDGSIDSTAIHAEHPLPAMDIQNLWGMHSSREQEFQASQAIIEDIGQLVLSETHGAIMNHNWYANNDHFLFCREKVETLADLEDRAIRTLSPSVSRWVGGMGAYARRMAHPQVRSAIEGGIVDCVITGGGDGFRHRWYQVTEYIIGPLFSMPFGINVISSEKWASIPKDLQQIILEEAAKSELESLRLAAVQNEFGLLRNTSDDPRNAGPHAMEHVPFSDELNHHSRNTALLERVLPGWVSQVGDTRHPIIADSFNNRIGPIVGLHIETDGSVVKIPITQGPYSGKTVEQALAE